MRISASLVYSVVAGLLVALLLLLAVRGMRRDQEMANEVDRTLMAGYVRLVGEGRFAQAWETCLSSSYRKNAPLERFVAAHEKRRKETGGLQGGRLLRSQASRSLFSKVRELQLLYELSYPGGVERNYVVLNDADGAFRVDGTYCMTAGETLSFLLW